MIWSKTKTVRFEDVGRGKKTFEVQVRVIGDLLDRNDMLRAVRKSGALMSRDIEVIANPFDPEHAMGAVFAGMRVVGAWRVVEKAEAK